MPVLWMSSGPATRIKKLSEKAKAKTIRVESQIPGGRKINFPLYLFQAANDRDNPPANGLAIDFESGTMF